MENGSLATILRKFGPLPEDLVTKYVRQVLEGLDYLHSKGVIHRDIKAANLLLTKTGNVKLGNLLHLESFFNFYLADFGISVNLVKMDNSRRDEVPGSPFWLAPEIIQNEGSMCSPASDIWSLGWYDNYITLKLTYGSTTLELLQGEPPYWDKGALPAMFAMVEEEHPPFPDDVSQVILSYRK